MRWLREGYAEPQDLKYCHEDFLSPALKKVKAELNRGSKEEWTRTTLRKRLSSTKGTEEVNEVLCRGTVYGRPEDNESENENEEEEWED